jgi:hypothetical protein
MPIASKSTDAMAPTGVKFAACGPCHMGPYALAVELYVSSIALY